MERRIEVIATLNPDKECQDRVRVFGGGGVAPALRATDYKDPPKICEWSNDKRKGVIWSIKK